ncbi:tetratricopeptide repeat protein [Leucothrix sargassi]|nr:tetratricopeptide repeat protein [Leucothrix sargassi]
MGTLSLNDWRESVLKLRADGHHTAAVESFKKLLEEYPNDQRAYIDIAISYRELGNFEESLHFLDTLIQRGNTQENWRKVAEKNLFPTLFPYINQLLSDGQTIKAKTNWEKFLKQHRINRQDYPKVLLINFKISCEMGFGEALGIQNLYFIKEQSQRSHYEAVAREVAFYFLKTGNYDLAKELASWFATYAWSDLIKLSISFETQPFLETLLLTDNLLEKPNLAHHIKHNIYQKRFNLGLLLSEPRISEDALHQLNTLGNTDDSWVKALLTIRQQYLTFYKSVNSKKIAECTSDIDLTKIYRSAIEQESSFFNQVIISSLYLSKLILPLGHSKHIKGEAKKIPKVIMQYWDQPLPPEDVQRNIESWKKTYSDYEHKLFNFDSAKEYVRRNFGEKQFELLSNCKHPAMQADVFRLFFLYNEGGIYADVDIFCQNKISTQAEATLRFQIFNILEVTNDYIVLPKKSPLIQLALDKLQSFDNQILEEKNVWWVTGPGLFNYCLAQIYSAAIVQQKDLQHAIKLIHNSEYLQNIKPKTLAYKQSTLAWQLKVTANS